MVTQTQPHYYFPHPAITSLKADVRPSATLDLPEHPGSMLRGVLGHALLSRFCQCAKSSAHRPDCLYAHLFEGCRRNGQDGIPAVLLTPLDHSRRVAHTEHFSFLLHFIGLSPVIQNEVQQALAKGLEHGLGRPLVPCVLDSWSTEKLALPSELTHLELKLTTPWLVKRKGKALTARTFSIHDVLIGLAHRQRIISEHFDLELPLPANREILAFADGLHVKAQLEDSSWIRHSNRQHTRHPLTGVIGHFHIKGEEAFPDWFGTLITNGLALHGGGKTSFGLGALQASWR